MKGYKAFNNDMTCRGMQYEVGKTYEMDEAPIICERGFHFCKDIADVYNFYDRSDETIICQVEAIGDIASEDDESKFCTNKIKIVEEIKSKKIKHCNVDKTEVGFCNSGNCNSGNCNSGDYNSGNRNSGDRNSGDYNSGDRNSGNRNSGNCNSGNRNSGDRNSGDYNSGNRNSGNCNSGNCNSGDYNSGNCNSGNCNSGNRNSGDRNSGDYNSGNYNSGYCNTDTPKVRLFNHETDMDFDDERIYKLRLILSSMPSSYVYSNYVREFQMSDEEKDRHPEYKTIGGYIKTIRVEADKMKWWNEEVSERDKEFIRSLPNYDEDIFFKSTGIKE